jgi:hypothetical protein
MRSCAVMNVFSADSRLQKMILFKGLKGLRAVNDRLTTVRAELPVELLPHTQKWRDPRHGNTAVLGLWISGWDFQEAFA